MTGDGEGVLTPMSSLVGVSWDVLSSLLCEDSGGLGVGFSMDDLGRIVLSPGG